MHTYMKIICKQYENNMQRAQGPSPGPQIGAGLGPGRRQFWEPGAGLWPISIFTSDYVHM